MSNENHIVFLDRATLPEDIEPDFSAVAGTYVAHDRTETQQTADRLKTATIAITNKVRIGSAELEAAPELRLIVVAATGTDCVDVPACSLRGISVCNVRDYAQATVPEHVFALILGLRRSIGAYHGSVQRGRWQEAGQFCYFDYPVDNLSGQVLGVMGSGALGSRVAELGRAFGMEVLFAGRRGDLAPQHPRTPFPEVLQRADVISLHLPLTSDSRGLLSAGEFNQMARRPIVINTARGPLIDEIALLEALNTGQVSGAGIDVAMPEPPPEGGALMQIARHSRAIVTPHVAWAGRQAIHTLAEQLQAMVLAGIAGKPFNLVAP